MGNIKWRKVADKASTKMAKLLPDFPSGPLDYYRKKASFDWKKLKIFMETEEIIYYLDELYEELQKHRILFSQTLETPSVDEQKRICNHMLYVVVNMKQFSIVSKKNHLRKSLAATLTLSQLHPSVGYKHYVICEVFRDAIQRLGTDRHSNYLERALKGEILAAYCFTEVGHGSNAKCMQTTATYDKTTQEFVLHTPNFQASKCWAGLLGHMATHAFVYAQLGTPDGINQGLHTFFIKVRNPNSMLPYPGITVGDMGEKIGLNGVDNGFIIFNHYRIPRTDLLNKIGDVTEDGRYVSPFKDPNKRYGAAVGILSEGRVFITGLCYSNLSHALTIAIRYAAVRKQFGPDGEDELPILEYQMHQYRLIPYLSVAYVLKCFASYLFEVQGNFSTDLIRRQNSNQVTYLGLELHAISSASKAVCGWIVRDGLQECREACGGHGYLKVAGIGDIKNAHDANLIYEGENYVLIQVISSWLLRFWPLVLQKKTVSSPLHSVDFLTNACQILNTRCNISTSKDFVRPNNILNMYQWLVCHLLKSSHDKYIQLNKNEKLDSFTAKNDSQIFFLKSLAVAYIQHFMLKRMFVVVSEASDPQIKDVLGRLLSLYGVFSLEKHVATFYQGGYAVDGMFTTLLQNSILMLCRSLKDDAVALIDVIAPPDFLIKSVLGRSDGEVYKHLENALVHVPGALDRPKWWKEIVDLKNVIKSKL